MDNFCDLDLEKCTNKSIKISWNILQQSLEDNIKEIKPDALVLGTGMEEIDVHGIRVLNNSSKKIHQVSDKAWLANWLEKKGFPFIPTIGIDDIKKFPVIVKPKKGAGGYGCKLFDREGDIILNDELIIQPWIRGRPASASVISDGQDSITIALNEQLIGTEWTGSKDFLYSGNLTPLDPDCPEISSMAEDIISELGLIGSNGIDFILTERGPIVVEVNPRFQGSLDSIELSTKINVFRAHLRSFDGILPDKPLQNTSAGRAVIYARENIFVEKKMNGKWKRDVPKPGTWIKKGMPFCSILAQGNNRAAVLHHLKKDAVRTLKISDKSLHQY